MRTLHHQIQLAVFCLALCFAVTVDAQPSRAMPLESIFTGSDFAMKRLANLRWSADGRSFTYTRAHPDTGLLEIFEQSVDKPGERLLLPAGSATYNGKPIAFSSYHWSADQKFLLLSGPVERTWDSVRQAPYYVYNTLTQSTTAIADGDPELRNVAMSPAGTHVGFVQKNNLYILSLIDRQLTAITSDGSADIFNGIFDYGSTEFGFLDAWHWSPDSKKIAFWRLDVTDVKVWWMIDELGKYPEVRPMKYPNTDEAHAVNQIGVYALSSKKTRWMDIGDNSDDYIPRIDWTRSSNTLAIQRLSRDHDTLNLLLADTNSGKSTVVVTDTDPAWIDITTDLTFFEQEDRFVWTSEKSGYRHAYLYDYSGAERQLTQGDWEIHGLIGLDEAGGWLYFSAKKDSLIDQHIYRVKLNGGPVQKLTENPGWYHWNFSPDFRHVIEEYSNVSVPWTFRLREPGGKTKRALLANSPEGLDNFDVPNPEFFQFDTSDGIRLNAYMIKPPNFDPAKKYPVIAYGYGNAGSQMVVNRWGSSRGVQRDLWHRYMATQGYVVFCMDNRTTAGRGKKAKNLTNGEYGKWAVLDQLQGVEHLKTLPFIDATRLGFWGWSGGGYLTAAMMTKGSPHYKVGVSVAPVIDLENYQAVGVERWMDQLSVNQQGYDAVNLINFVDRLEGKLLLIHGTGDENVKWAFTLQFADALIKAGKQFDMMVYPNEHHGIEGARQHVYTKIASYFKDNL
ncbi:MAG: S9 family peptidase [Lysobacterales bacterium]